MRPRGAGMKVEVEVEGGRRAKVDAISLARFKNQDLGMISLSH